MKSIIKLQLRKAATPAFPQISSLDCPSFTNWNCKLISGRPACLKCVILSSAFEFRTRGRERDTIFLVGMSSSVGGVPIVRGVSALDYISNTQKPLRRPSIGSAQFAITSRRARIRAESARRPRSPRSSLADPARSVRRRDCARRSGAPSAHARLRAAI